MDDLSVVLSTIRLDGAVYFNAEFSAPWCGEASFGMPAERVRKMGADHIIFFHCVTEGSCLARLSSQHTGVELKRGDLVAFPHDSTHVLGSDLSLSPVDARRAIPVRDPDDFLQLRMGGGGELTRFVCGYLACNRRVSRSLLAALPEMFVVSLAEDQTSSWLLDMLDLAVRESINERPGAQSLLTKISELLFTESLRRYSDGLPEDQSGWLAGLRDPLVGRALAQLHRSPAQSWSLQSLARASATSRSVLGERFRQLLGAAPMQYLANHRMALAAQSLRASDLPIAQIAADVGYGSEAAFTRAFKRNHGMAPGSWRRTPLTHAASG